MTKRTVLLLALAATTGVPALAACSTAERQAPLPPSAAGPAFGTGSIDTASPGSLPLGTVSGGSVPLTADGRSVPTSGTVGANVTPGPSGSSGGLRTRPDHVPGPAGSSDLPSETYRVGRRAPWSILLDDRPRPSPEPLPAADPRDSAPQDGPAKPPADGVVILADGAPVVTKAAPLPALPPGQAKKADEPLRLPTGVSFPALLSVLPPSTADVVAPSDEKQGKHDQGTEQPQGPGSVSLPTPPTTDVVRPGSTVPQQNPTPVTQTTAPTTSPTHEPKAPGPKAPGPKAPAATGWHIDGLSLTAPAPDAAGRRGSPAFRKALRASLNQRPDTAKPGPAALRRWSASLQKAAALAPDPHTKQQLRTLARYADDLAGTPAPKRAALQQKRPGAIDAANALRASLPRRFGVSLLG